LTGLNGREKMTLEELAKLHYSLGYGRRRIDKLGSIKQMEYDAYFSRLVWVDAYSQPVPF